MADIGVGIAVVVVVDDGTGLIAVDDTDCCTNALSCEFNESDDGSADVGIVNGILINSL